MVLSKTELTGLLQNEVRILLHLISKIDRAKLDYRPTAKQRSTLELVRYLSMMGPALVAVVKKGTFRRRGPRLKRPRTSWISIRRSPRSRPNQMPIPSCWPTSPRPTCAWR